MTEVEIFAVSDNTTLVDEWKSNSYFVEIDGNKLMFKTPMSESDDFAKKLKTAGFTNLVLDAPLF